jgi:uncharacterized protein (TIGR00296 family)
MTGLRQFAINAAIRDRRFTPVSGRELEHLECQVSLLHSFEKCHGPLDWEVGVHGTTFTMGRYRATFLPEVARELKWTKEQTLEHLAKKSGLKRKITVADYPEIDITRYRSSHIRVTWAEDQEFVASLQ